MEDLIAIPLGFFLDQLIGDPPAWPHPVRWIGRLIQMLEPPLRRKFKSERRAGLVLLLLVAGITGAVTWAALAVSGLFLTFGDISLARIALATVLVYFGLAAHNLAWEAEAVVELCVFENWPEARQRLSRIVGRDTENLKPDEVHRACIETVAESTTDGVVAPLFFAALAGPVGLWIYKAVNTLDSMVGYRNERYKDFGWASARLDDVLNFIPARLSCCLIALAAYCTGHRGGQALRIGWRDGRKHPSPNAGWAEAAMAGALGIQLGGTSTYSGVPSAKPLLGDPLEPLTPLKVRQAITVLRVTAWLTMGVMSGFAIIRFLLFLSVRNWVKTLFQPTPAPPPPDTEPPALPSPEGETPAKQ
ncbi:MAG TPA: adenosylcobinamide-phosphate synthase CbiB [Gemmataceae bacterium]|nr:adenosylcobinamide-phosphate synthase CbiB [Gemmataceae bacterium]